MAKIKFNSFIYRGPATRSPEQDQEDAAWEQYEAWKDKMESWSPILNTNKIKITTQASQVQEPKMMVDPHAAVIAYAPKVIDLTEEQVKEALFTIEEDNGDKIVSIRYNEAHGGMLKITIVFKSLREIAHYELSRGLRPSDKNYVRVEY